jgi:hypothetical protein
MTKTLLRYLSILTLFFSHCSLHAQSILPPIPFERDSNTTSTYHQTIAYYELMADRFRELALFEEGITDAGYPLHVAVLSTDGDFSPASLRAKGKRILFINNGIHAGEPCGVDASMLLLRDFLLDKDRKAYLENLVLVIIPFYNIGGGLNRGAFSRANQMGPKAYGFRGNAKNLDLNRDFIKCDSRNARTFNLLFNRWQPDVFIDNHTTNGADYPYVMTLIASQPDKLDPNLTEYMEGQLLPRLYRDMALRNYEMTPYVYARGTPDNGIAGFLDLSRYSSGYAVLHNTISFIAETHMLKPYRDRVMSSYNLMEALIYAIHEDHERIGEVRRVAIDHTIDKDTFDLRWGLDTGKKDSLLFNGYEAKYKSSDISGLDRLYYDRKSPYEKMIPYFRHYRATAQIKKPVAYFIPQAYREVVDRLRWNGVEVRRLTEYVELELEFYYIRNFETTEYPYEGHYLHSNVEVEKKRMRRTFRSGDYVVFVNQPANRYIVETLEPQGSDSFFAWNFFDGILMQKEHFSSYVFEDLAAEYLEQHPELRKELEAKKEADEEFARSARAQLDFIYKNSPYYEPTHNLYPVGRLVEELILPVD